MRTRTLDTRWSPPLRSVSASHRPPFGRMWRTAQLLGVLVGVMLLAGGCGSDGVFIDPPAQPAVNRIVAAPSLQRWAFTYQPNSASPYLACLTGVDGVTGVVDLAAGAVIVEPDRNAPPVIVTNSSFLVPARSGRGWDEVRWGPNSDPASLYPIFEKHWQSMWPLVCVSPIST